MKRFKKFVGTFKTMVKLFKVICEGANIKNMEVIKFFDKGYKWHLILVEDAEMIKVSTWKFCEFLYSNQATFFWNKAIEGVSFEWKA